MIYKREGSFGNPSWLNYAGLLTNEERESHGTYPKANRSWMPFALRVVALSIQEPGASSSFTSKLREENWMIELRNVWCTEKSPQLCLGQPKKPKKIG